MRSRFVCWLALAGLLSLAAPPLRAGDDDSPVPPWGRDLETAHPVADTPSEGGEHLPRVWGRFEYLLWWMRDERTPPLLTQGVTTSPRPGALDDPLTRTLHGGRVDFNERHGGRFTLGALLFGESGAALEANYLYQSGRDVGIQLGSPGNPVLARPFFDVLNLREDASLISYPGLALGRIDIDHTSHLQGAEINLHREMCRGEKWHIEWLAGLRWLGLDEELTILESSSAVVDDPLDPLFGKTFRGRDSFHTDNHFLGGQLGLRSSFHWKRFHFGLTPKVAVGAVLETVTIEGRTVESGGGATKVTEAGLLALASNSGRHRRTEFAVVPEVSGTIGLAVTEHLRVFAGYSFLWWSNVARPGGQIDRGLHPDLIPTSTTFGGPAVPRRPEFRFDQTDWFVHGVQIGLEWRY